MDDLRSEIREAFEKEQAAHPPEVSLRHEVVRGAARQPRRQPNVQWLAMVATIVIGTLIVVALMSSRLNNRGAVPRSAASSAQTATPAGDYGPPPAGVPLFYVGDANHPGWYVAYDWQGVPRGTLKFASAYGLLVQSPDGSAFIASSGAKGGTGEFLDRLGNPAGSVPAGALWHWADDGRHTCGIAFDQVQLRWTLVTAAPGEGQRSVALVAQDSEIGQTGIDLASCSFRADRAVAVRTSVSSPSELWVIQLSSGKLLVHRTYDSAVSMANLVSSSDASLIAENSSKSIGSSDGPPTYVRRLSDGSLVATLDPSMGVLAFSSDNSVALVTTTPWRGGASTHLAAVELATGRVVWTYDGDQELSGFLVEPIGVAFVVMVQEPQDQNPHPAVGVLTVYPSGQSAGIPGRFVRP